MSNPGQGSQEPWVYETPPGLGKLALWVLLFVVAAIVVVVGGVYFA